MTDALDQKGHKWAPIMDGKWCCQYCMVDYGRETTPICEKAPASTVIPAEIAGVVEKLLTKAVMLDTSNHGSVSATRDMLREAATLIERLAASQAETAPPATGTTFQIEHDGFAGEVIGGYVTREGKRGVVLQQFGTRVVHVYGEKWLVPIPSGQGGET